ncbi:hypothetical protein HPP92_009629 [Vanilla planifolia]|uniref:RRM domain-containing protein n=1 Tax=Vanilla planifolia TaxID=51239 RepID=A0A835RCR0_VANPL|nr:hypothetical protein HPP92_009629 [Vanilla planifolia]
MEAASAAVCLDSSLLLSSSSFRRSRLASSSSFSFPSYRAQFPFPSLLILPRPRRFPVALSVAVEDTELEEDQNAVGGVIGAGDEKRRRVQPCELYVCNLPRSYDISHLLELFKPYGVVQSVEVSRDQETGISRGSGYVTMGSISEAKSVIKALDGSDVAGREMRVMYSADMTSGRKNVEALNSAPKKNIIFESPYKIYVGNLAWFVKPEDLRDHFSKYGTVVSTRVLHDRKRGKNRVYAFLSFSSPHEAKAATEANESVFYGRMMLVKEIVDQKP